MKKDPRQATNPAARRRKLVLNREAIAELTPAELGHVAGGLTGSVGPFCNTTLVPETE